MVSNQRFDSFVGHFEGRDECPSRFLQLNKRRLRYGSKYEVGQV